MHEVTSPQAFDGLRMAGRPVRRPDLTIATEDHNTPTLAIDKPIRDLTSRTQIETLRKNTAEFGVRLHPLGDIEQGIVHVVGPQLGLDPAGHHGRVRRLAHLDARRVRRDGVRHRHERGRARARDADAAAQAVQDDGDHGRGRAEAGCDGQGHHPRGHREDRHRRRAGLRARVPRQRHPRPVDGWPHDHLQHVDRGGRASRHGRARRDHLRLPQGSRPRAGGCRLGCRGRVLETRSRTDDDAVFDAEVFLDANELEPFVTWGTNPGQGVSLSRVGARPVARSPTRTSGPPPSARSSTWRSRRARR